MGMYGLEMPDIVVLAHEVVELYRENKRLKEDIEHYKELADINQKSVRDSIKHNENMIGTMLKAAIDPDSIINKSLKD